MRTVVILCLILCTRTAMACSTCYTNPDAPQTHAMNMAIMFMLGVVTMLLGLFAAFFLHLRIRAKQVTAVSLGSQISGHS